MRIAISLGHAFSNKPGKGYQFDPGYVNQKYRISESEVVGLCGNLLMEILRYPSSIEAVRIPRVSLQERIKIINAMHKKEPFDLAIDIHMNGFKDHRVRGTEVWYDPRRMSSSIAADIFCNAISHSLHSRDRGIKSSAGLAFLREVIPTPVLTEAEFLSNDIVARDVEDFLIPKMAWGHALAILDLSRNKKDLR